MKINADGFKTFGQTENLVCPKCKNIVNMQILKSSSGLGIFNIPIYEYQVELFTICPNCGGVFAVNKETSKLAGNEKSNKYNCISEARLKHVKDINLNG
ncbi:MAG: zinc-ribbon domain-containing protein [Oscillospiraceae bacterium]|nr:zinc-ribbon domain-containing protein [Oscillospiraceae bacterium]